MQGRRGFSLIEIVVVIGIIAVLAAIGYSVSAPAREKARQATCISQLKQIYAAVVMYSSDHEGAPTMPQQPHVVFAGDIISGLLPYTKSADVFCCPDYPSALKAPYKYPSSYQWRWQAFAPQNADDKAWYEQLMAGYEQDPTTYPMMICLTHDEVYYAPSEQVYDPAIAQAFSLDLRFDGSVHAERGRHHRRPKR